MTDSFASLQLPPLPPSLRLRLDADALEANWRTLDAMSGNARAGAAVKANGYGLGAARVSHALAQAGCQDFFVAHWSEVTDLLGAVAADRISVLHGPMNAAEVAFAQATGVRPVINSLEQAARWHAAGGGLCHLMVDTGMNRLGLAMSDMGDAILAKLNIDICMSHLASADEDVVQNELQRVRFADIRRTIKSRRYSLSNSAGIALGSGFHADLTRPGLALFGGIPRREFAESIVQVAYPEASVIQVRSMQAGESAGYNASFTASRHMRVGVLATGYADGYLRCWSGQGEFDWMGRKVPVLGRVSMDLTIVDLTHAPDCREGDWLTATYNLAAASRRTGLSQYELLTLLGQRFDRDGAG